MSATINQSYSDAIRQIHTWLVLELTPVHKAYKLASFREPVTLHALNGDGVCYLHTLGWTVAYKCWRGLGMRKEAIVWPHTNLGQWKAPGTVLSPSNDHAIIRHSLSCFLCLPSHPGFLRTSPIFYPNLSLICLFSCTLSSLVIAAAHLSFSSLIHTHQSSVSGSSLLCTDYP
jgi:hypothetical protein